MVVIPASDPKVVASNPSASMNFYIGNIYVR